MRHAPESIGLQLDENGWAPVEELLEKFSLKIEDLQYVVENNSKKRFAFNEDQSEIRANQGHSISINLGLEQLTPPDILYHGTAIRNLESIKEKGILKQKRHHVHLSIETSTAKEVGSRYGKPIVLEIDAKSMTEQGHVFFKSENGVWLTDKVAPEFIL